MKIGQSLTFTKCIDVNCVGLNPGHFLTSAVLRRCSAEPFDSVVNLLSRQLGHLSQLVVWHENFVGIAIIRKGGACDLYHRLGIHHVQLFVAAAKLEWTRTFRSPSAVSSGERRSGVTNY